MIHDMCVQKIGPEWPKLQLFPVLQVPCGQKEVDFVKVILLECD